jgi:hypothetical protein
VTLQTTTERPLPFLRHLGLIAALALAIAWGMLAGVVRAPYFAVVVGGLAASALGFWLERAVLITPETRARKDFQLIVVAGYGMFAVVGVGLVSLSALLSRWWLPHV